MEQNKKYHLAASEEGEVSILEVESLPPFLFTDFLVCFKKPTYFISPLNYIRTEVSGDFNIRGPNIFRMLFSVKNLKTMMLYCLMFLWWQKKPVLSMKY